MRTGLFAFNLVLSGLVAPSVVYAAGCRIDDVTWPQGERNRACHGAWHFQVRKLCEFQDEGCGECLEPKMCDDIVWSDWYRVESIDTGWKCMEDVSNPAAYCNEISRARRAEIKDSLVAQSDVEEAQVKATYVVKTATGPCRACCAAVTKCPLDARHSTIQGQLMCGCNRYPTCQRPCAPPVVENSLSAALGSSRSALEAEIRELPDYELIKGTEWCTSAEDMPANSQDEVRAKFQRAMDSYNDQELQDKYGSDSAIKAHVIQMKLIYEFYAQELSESQQEWAKFLYLLYPEYEHPCGS